MTTSWGHPRCRKGFWEEGRDCSSMPCAKCAKKQAGKPLACPDKWKEGSREQVSSEHVGIVVLKALLKLGNHICACRALAGGSST